MPTQATIGELPYNFKENLTTHEKGCGSATGWDRGSVEGKHPCGLPMKISFRRWMNAPKRVTWECHVDACVHAFGNYADIEKGEIQTTFQDAWHKSATAAFTQGEQCHDFSTIA